MTKNYGIKARLLFSFLLVGLAPLVIMAAIAYSNSSKTIETESFSKLTAVNELKAEAIEDYFATIRKQVSTMAGSVSIQRAMWEFKQAYKSYPDEALLPEEGTMRDAVWNYYRDEFQATYNESNTNNVEGTLKQILGDLGRSAIALQYSYIANNKNALGSKHLLDFANDGSTYAQLHDLYHPSIRKFLEEFGYYDIFLVDSETGDIVYSVFKELDFTTSLKTGPYASSNFGEAFNRANAATDPSAVFLVDFAPYFPSYNSPASFIAAPIFMGKQKIGVILFQMPIDKINSIMTNDQHWSEVGLGTTGESYIVGPDSKMRSQARFLADGKNADLYIEKLKETGAPSEIVEKIQSKQTSILFQEVSTPAAQHALDGETGIINGSDYFNDAAVSAYRPLKIEDMSWAIVTDQENSEIFASLTHLAWIIGVALSVCAVLVIAIALLTARSFAGPLTAIMSKLHSSSSQVNTSAKQVSSSSDALAQGATEQAASLEETVASLEEIASMAKQNADNAQQADSLTESVSNLSGRGVESMKSMSDAIHSIQTSADETSEIIKVIDDIAFQTNLLALNAAVEAARAGDAGKGFAVVAEEVRKLALRSAEAAKNTSEKIKRSKSLADNGVRVSKDVGNALEEINVNSKQAAILVKEIAAASKEQSSGVSQLNTAAADLDKVTQTNAASAEESAAASQELLVQSSGVSEVADSLQRIIFGLKDSKSSKRRDSTPPQSTKHTPRATVVRPGKIPASNPSYSSKQFEDLKPNQVIPLDNEDFAGF